MFSNFSFCDHSHEVIVMRFDGTLYAEWSSRFGEILYAIICKVEMVVMIAMTSNTCVTL